MIEPNNPVIIKANLEARLAALDTA
jgi:hypothetical protein